MDYLIIGNSAAGIGGVEGIRKNDPEGKITVVSDEPYHCYSRPLISYFLSGKVDYEKMKYRADDFYQKNNIETRLGTRVRTLKPSGKKVVLETGEVIKYDKLLLATGGLPFVPPVKGSDKENIYTFIKLDDAYRLKDIVETPGKSGSQSAVILGAGLIGLKVAEALAKLGLKVTVVELADRVLSTILDQEAAAIIQKHLEDKGIRFNLADTIEEFAGNKKANTARLKSGFTLDCDLGIVAVGVRPNLELVKDTPLEVNRGILINNQMETSIEDIYASGDVCEGQDMLRGTSGVIPIWPNAYNQGLTAGQNMAGADQSYDECFARNSIGFFGLPMITAGIINPLEEEIDQYEIYRQDSPGDNSYKKIIIKDDRIVGFICINNVDRAGILTGLIKEQKNIADIKDKILNADFGYLSFSEEWRREKLTK